VLLSQWLKENRSKKECARRLGRDIKTIRRELKRNSYRVNGQVSIRLLLK
jgi:IS30 family transposase